VIIRRVELRNIFSHENTSAEFPDGVVAIIGPNGAGKSSIVDSIYMALFTGSQIDIRGGKKEHIITAGASAGEIRVEVEIDGRRYLVTRRLSVAMPTEANLYVVEGDAKRLRATKIEGVLSEITRLLGLRGLSESDVRKLVRSTVIALQGELTEIVDIGDAKRREYILSLLGLGYLERALEEIKEITKEKERLAGEWRAKQEVVSNMKKSIEKLRRDEEELQKQISALEKRIAESEKLVSDLEARQRAVNEYLSISKTLEIALAQRRIRELEAIIEKLREIESWWSSDRVKLVRLLEEVSGLEIEVERTERSVLETLRELSEIFEREVRGLSNAESLLSTLERRVEEAEAYSNLYKVYMEKFEITGTCPLCGSRIEDTTSFRLHLESRVSELESAIKSLNEKITVARSAVTRLRQYESRLQALRDLLEKRRSELQVLINSTLELCARHSVPSVSVEVCVRELSVLGEKYSEYRGELKSLREVYAGIAPLGESVEVLWSRLRGVSVLGVEPPSSLDTNTIRQLVSKLSEMREVVSRDYERALRELSNLKASLEKLRGQLENTRNQLARYEADVRRIEEELVRIKKRIEAYEVLEEFANKYLGKNGVIARELTRVTRIELEKRANVILSRLRLREISIGDGFEIYVRVPGSVLPIKNASGGERVAVAIALRLALAELAMGRSPTVLILDEPTVNLDDERVTQVFNIIGEIGRTLRQVIVVTHDEKVIDIADAVIRVENIGNTSRVSREY